MMNALSRVISIAVGAAVVVIAIRFALLRTVGIDGHLVPGIGLGAVALVAIQVGTLGIAETFAGVRAPNQTSTSVMVAVAIALLVEGSVFAIGFDEAGVLFTLGIPALLAAGFALAASPRAPSLVRTVGMTTAIAVASVALAFWLGNALCSC